MCVYVFPSKLWFRSPHKQGYSLAEEIANKQRQSRHWLRLYVGLVLPWFRRGGSQCQRHGDNQLQPLWRQYDPAVPRFGRLSRHSHQRAKMWLKKFDHCAIYLLIAGTYTPFLLVGLDSR